MLPCIAWWCTSSLILYACAYLSVCGGGAGAWWLDRSTLALWTSIGYFLRNTSMADVNDVVYWAYVVTTPLGGTWCCVLRRRGVWRSWPDSPAQLRALLSHVLSPDSPVARGCIASSPLLGTGGHSHRAAPRPAGGRLHAPWSAARRSPPKPGPGASGAPLKPPNPLLSPPVSPTRPIDDSLRELVLVGPD